MRKGGGGKKKRIRLVGRGGLMHRQENLSSAIVYSNLTQGTGEHTEKRQEAIKLNSKRLLPGGGRKTLSTQSRRRNDYGECLGGFIRRGV